MNILDYWTQGFICSNPALEWQTQQPTIKNKKNKTCPKDTAVLGACSLRECSKQKQRSTALSTYTGVIRITREP